ncbi:MAG: class I SAM-dependent methyltransferase [Patescibacteria group bacterium]
MSHLKQYINIKLDVFCYQIRFLGYFLILKFSDLIKPTIISKALSYKIVKIFSGGIGQGSKYRTPHIGLGLIHYSLIRLLKPKKILCIGSYRGFIPAICALACKDNKFGSIDFVDAGFSYNGKLKILGDGYWKKKQNRNVFNTFLKSTKLIKVYVMTTNEYARRYSKKQFQYIYIDGDHTYKGVKTDYKLFWPQLDKGGLMLFHDVLGRGVNDVKFGVKKFWNNLNTFNKIIIPVPKNSGLGILQK